LKTGGATGPLPPPSLDLSTLFLLDLRADGHFANELLTKRSGNSAEVQEGEVFFGYDGHESAIGELRGGAFVVGNSYTGNGRVLAATEVPVHQKNAIFILAEKTGVPSALRTSRASIGKLQVGELY
jgi:hypothetical protein